MKVLLIQTAFLGDVILATSLVEMLYHQVPNVQVDILVRKGNESLLKNHPLINNTLVWDKKTSKYRNLWRLILQSRATKYDLVVNCQRFAGSGLFTILSGAKATVGFDKNPFSMFFTCRIAHKIGDGNHEIERNAKLIAHIAPKLLRPKLYPSNEDYQHVKPLQHKPYRCIAPTSVWFTKQLPAHKWVELINTFPDEETVYLLGSNADKDTCEMIKSNSRHRDVVNLAGDLSLLCSASLLEGAIINYVNDSAPLHLCSSMNAPVMAVFCSTVPQFGFTPLSDKSKVIETTEKLSCRPCGLHGKAKCPKGHFLCAESIYFLSKNIE